MTDGGSRRIRRGTCGMVARLSRSLRRQALWCLCLTFIRLPPVALAMTGAWLTAAWADIDVQQAKLCPATFGTLSSAGRPA